MKRVAIFVEGQSELIFVREFLLKWFNYQVDLECRNLFTDEKIDRADYDFSNPSTDVHFQVINVGMDGNVLSRILSREQYLYNASYEKIIGLRDMYSGDYKRIAQDRIVDLQVNGRFKQGALVSIDQKAKRPGQIRFCFAIMELEAWWIGIPSLWESIDAELKQQNERWFLFPESIFHPAVFIDQIFQSKNNTYKKKKAEVESIVGKISREDYVELDTSQRCPSFCELVQYVQHH